MEGKKTATGDGSIPESEHPYATMKDYGAALPAPTTYDNTRPQRSRTRRRRVAVIGCCCLFLALLFFVGVVILIHWLILQPKDGNCDLVDADLSLFNLTHVGSQLHYELDTDIGFKIAFGNPNTKIRFDIKDINVHTLYAGEEIGQTALPPFQQPRKNETILAPRIKVTHHVFSETIGGALHSEMQSSNITLQVMMNAKLRNNHGMLTSLHQYHAVHLTCSVSLKAPGANRTSAPGVMISKRCGVKR